MLFVDVQFGGKKSAMKSIWREESAIEIDSLPLLIQNSTPIHKFKSTISPPSSTSANHNHGDALLDEVLDNEANNCDVVNQNRTTSTLEEIQCMCSVLVVRLWKK